MKISTHDDSFTVFPYRKDYSDGRTNNGGIDLLKEPYRIDEISEARSFPELRNLILQFNAENGKFFTLGCESGYDENGIHYGYIEFAFRSQELASDLKLNEELDEKFYAWVRNQDVALEGLLKGALVWEFSYYSHEGSSQRIKVTITFCATNQNNSGQVLDIIATYFTTEINHC
ncbi:hypothetical protein [Desulfoluna butyratoxydans]|uniref:Uncharacterized protein n=1 Tax=Desulfoluna butyratoxydans TaxID=231438 RepID=A0A4U8YU21_9BACT|nr:hypothetical protein [Desulfoluna butyratoxydans]VFQ47384.1 hypothetical protein MSL71_50840 [Desulfoluna butyratoxydans]